MYLLKDILFLIKNQSKVEIILFYLKNKLFSIFYKNTKKKIKRQNQLFLKNKKITNDYFSMNAFYFYQNLKKIINFRNYLEIGSYEGNSAMFVSRNFENVKVYCVDTWSGSAEHKNQNFNNVEKNFDENTEEFFNIKKNKICSDSFFEKNSKKFDCIYVDGNHYFDQVYKDCVNSLNCLEDQGLLIFDDYTWKYFKNPRENPCFAINQFIKKYGKKLKIIEVSNSQIFVKKIN